MIDGIQFPISIVEMPVNQEGKGPEMDPTLVVGVVHQIWDENNSTIAESDFPEVAEFILKSLNDLKVGINKD